MRNNKILKITIQVILLVILGYIIFDNYYIITNKMELIYYKYFGLNNKQLLTSNEYIKKVNYEYVKVNPDKNIKNATMLKDAIYTFLDAGWENYTIICDPSYSNCISDAKTMAQNNSFLTDISNFVHPFNTFEKINTTFTSSGKITFSRKPRYTEEKIKQISEKIDSIYNENYDYNKSIRENIKTFHDYIINNTKYDTNNTTGASNINSSTAYGVLFEGLGICSGYTDTMSLFLEKMNIPNYRISSSSHVWNLVYIDNMWHHIDLTWDDPVTSDESNILSDNYFLITTNELKEKNDNEHDFDENIYLEAK